jgi:hypothetical protein
MAIGGDHFPDRAAVMAGILSADAIAGSLAYLPLMGVVSVTVGFSVAILRIAVFCVCAAAALVIIGWLPTTSPVRQGTLAPRN